MRYCDRPLGFELAKEMLAGGLDPNDQENGGSGALQYLVEQLEWHRSSFYLKWDQEEKNYDSSKARDVMKTIHLLAKHGGRWAPLSREQFNSARRSLLKMIPEYTVEFVWIMGKYNAASKTDLEQSLRTPTIKNHTRDHRGRLSEIMGELETSL